MSFWASSRRARPRCGSSPPDSRHLRLAACRCRAGPARTCNRACGGSSGTARSCGLPVRPCNKVRQAFSPSRMRARSRSTVMDRQPRPRSVGGIWRPTDWVCPVLGACWSSLYSRGLFNPRTNPPFIFQSSAKLSPAAADPDAPTQTVRPVAPCSSPRYRAFPQPDCR